MGAGKFPEEISERRWETSSTAEEIITTIGHFKPLRPAPPLHYCPLCRVGFRDPIDLDGHIARSHGNQHVYFRVNRTIVRDFCWLTSNVSDCEIVLLDIPTVQLKIDVNGVATRVTVSRTTSLKKHLTALEPGGTATLTVLDKAFCRTLTISVGAQLTFDSTRFDALLIAFMARGSIQQSIELRRLRQKLTALAANDLEHRYANGMAEYCHAVVLREERSRFSKDRLEEAFELLLPFETQLAREARCALSLVMNCFLGEWPCGLHSSFRLSQYFYCGGRKPRAVRIHHRPVVLLDTLTARFLEAISGFFDRNFDLVFRLVSDAEKSSCILDPNDASKLRLLEARALAETHESKRAAAVYVELTEHPLFAQEAQTFIQSAMTMKRIRQSPR